MSVKSGIATLEGKTDVPQRKGVATRLAKSGGAREVVNKIQISEAARKKLSDRLQKARESMSKPAAKTVQNTPTVKPPITAAAVARCANISRRYTGAAAAYGSQTLTYN